MTERPVITLKRDEFDKNARAGERALIAANFPVYRRDQLLVVPVICQADAANGRITATASLKPLAVPSLREMLNEAAAWEKYDARAKEFISTAPTIEIAELILDHAHRWEFPEIIGVISTPTMRPDGSLLTEPGYDRMTHLYLTDAPALSAIPDKPTLDDAKTALQQFEALLEEFPFADEVSRAIAYSAMITPVVRGAMRTAPMHAISSPLPGTGKSYLVDVAACIATGYPCAVISAGADEEEMEKRLGSVALAGQPIISLDNVNGIIKGDFLAQLIERPVIQVRILGASKMPTIENRLMVFATGNNLRGHRDINRRLLLCRLDAGMERPETRTFKKNPLALVQARRGRYITAALIVVRAYLAADRPDLKPPLPSFEQWSNIVRSALVWAGCADPCAGADTNQADDDDYLDTLAVLEEWPIDPVKLKDATGISTAGLIASATANDENGDLCLPKLLEALKAVGRDHRGNLDATVLGHWLRDHKDVVLGRRKLVRIGTATRPLWALILV